MSGRMTDEELALAASGGHGPAALEAMRKQRDAMRNRAENAEGMLQTCFQQIAEVARLLDPEVCPDAWGLHAAAQKRMAEKAALESEVAQLRATLYASFDLDKVADAKHAALLERVRRLEEEAGEALRFMDHRPGCQRFDGCDCGMEAASFRLRQAINGVQP